jgi:transcriptional regulator with XRE-family HTH domain
MRTSGLPILNRLWIARKKIGLGQKSVARLLGHKSTSPISEYETGRLTPSLRTAFKFSIIYNCPLPDLYESLYREVEDEINDQRKNMAPPPRPGAKGDS